MMIRRTVGTRASAVLASALLTAAMAAPAAAQAPATPAENPVLKFFNGTELSGFVDTYYAYNFNTPKTPCATVGGVAVFNCLHNFEVAHNAFSLNLVELALTKTPTTDSRAGFRVDLDYGPTAAMVAAFDPGGVEIYQHVQQAYVSYMPPTGKGSLTFDFGKFVTHNGAEVIESKDNWNYSRGLLFSWAIPYYHSGIRATYAANDKVTVMGEITNGWNNVVENNGGKTAGFELAYKPTSAASIVLNYTGGPEGPDAGVGTTQGWRHLFDAVLTYTASPTVSLMLNYDWAKDNNVPVVPNAVAPQWQGVALYAKFAPNSWLTLVPRYEYFKDRDGFATGTAQNLQEFTLTLEFKHKDGFMTRVEYRGDMSNVDGGYFIKNTSEMAKNQNALIVGWVYAFSTKTP